MHHDPTRRSSLSLGYAVFINGMLIVRLDGDGSRSHAKICSTKNRPLHQLPSHHIYHHVAHPVHRPSQPHLSPAAPCPPLPPLPCPSPLASKYRLLNAFPIPLVILPPILPRFVMVVLPIPANNASSSADCVTLASSRSLNELPMLGEALSEPGARRGDCWVEWRRARWEGDRGVPRRGTVFWRIVAGREAVLAAVGSECVGEDSEDVEEARSRAAVCAWTGVGGSTTGEETIRSEVARRCIPGLCAGNAPRSVPPRSCWEEEDGPAGLDSVEGFAKGRKDGSSSSSSEAGCCVAALSSGLVGGTF